MTARHTAAFALVALTIGCDGARREQARQDSIRALFAADSARYAPRSNPTKERRDSVRRGKIIRMPIVSDTAKRRPPT